eukprot:TRINITY_DN778314_c0_g1_i1.p1 TRINITY_DN778314_c0_g1~~TRINITY_DN778314_c0_g1_i1.p1  ORF type:complete len:125 (+),score=38.04 TRINITY_DN778314_c0_g1_i1:108-482(+)
MNMNEEECINRESASLLMELQAIEDELCRQAKKKEDTSSESDDSNSVSWDSFYRQQELEEAPNAEEWKGFEHAKVCIRNICPLIRCGFEKPVSESGKAEDLVLKMDKIIHEKANDLLECGSSSQ